MEISKEQKEAIEYYQNKEVSLSVDFDTENLLKALGITEEDSFENHQIRFKTLLNLIEKLQKENEELEEINNELEAEKNEAIKRYNFETIPIKKVKDKIEYLEDYIEGNSDEQGYWGNINPDVIYGQIEILEEILKLESE